MAEETILHQVEPWGYYLLPRPHPDSPGYAGLVVAIRDQPTGLHFDPETMEIRLLDGDGVVRRTLLTLDTPFSGSRRVCPGRVTLHDRVDKRIELFTFGGSLEAVAVPGETVYLLRSPAPILELNPGVESFSDQLASETEVTLAKIQARWGRNDDGYARRLAQIEAGRFYVASVQSILTRYERAPALKRSFHRFYAELMREKKWWEETVDPSGQPLTLEALLVPDERES